MIAYLVHQKGVSRFCRPRMVELEDIIDKVSVRLGRAEVSSGLVGALGGTKDLATLLG